MDYKKIISSKELRFKILGLFSWVPDRPWLTLLFRIKNGYWMDFKNPKTFNEKLQWLKVYGFRSEYTQMVDKYRVKDYVSEKIGEQYVIPTLGVWDKPEDVEWDKLPKEFVLKTTNGGGSFGVWLVKDKGTFDKEQFAKEIYARYPGIGKPHKKHIDVFREHPYDDVPIRILAEVLLKANDSSQDLEDYKFYCFNGEPVYCQVIRDRSTQETIDFYDMDWNHMPFVGLNPECKNGSTPVECPTTFEDMKRICRELAKDLPFARVDLYEVCGKDYFGEVTFYPAGGFGTFTPSEWNTKLGDLLKLEGLKRGGGYKCLIINDIVRVSQFDKDLLDYKFFCFNGKVKFFKVDFGRFTEHHANYYSTDGKLLPYGELDYPPKGEESIQLPSNLKEMVDVSEKLSIGIPFLRVDLYNVNGKIYFGELTFYPASGLGKWTDDKWDQEIGEMLEP